MPQMLDLDPIAKTLPGDHFRGEIAEGVRGTAQTIESMRKLINFGKRDMRLRPIIGKIIAGCAQKDYACYAKAIHDYWCHTIKYAYDPVDVELVEDAYNAIQAGIADCDSKVIGFCSMCEQIGLPCRMVTVKSSVFSSEYTHVYAEVFVKGKWIASDCTMPKEVFGWAPPPDMPKKVWPVSESAARSDEGGVDFMMMGMGCSGKDCSCGCSKKDSMLAEMGLSGGKFKPLRNRPKRRHRIAGMGDIFDSIFGGGNDVETIATEVYNGTYAQRLRQMNSDLNSATARLNSAADANRSDPTDEATAAIAAGRGAVADARQQVIEATGNYNFIVDELNRYGAGLQRAGLAVLPAAIPAAVLTGAYFVGAALALAAAWSAWSSYYSNANAKVRLAEQAVAFKKAGGNPSELPNIFNTDDSSIPSSIGTVVILGVIGTLAYMFMKKRGTI